MSRPANDNVAACPGELLERFWVSAYAQIEERCLLREEHACAAAAAAPAWSDEAVDKEVSDYRQDLIAAFCHSIGEIEAAVSAPGSAWQ